MVNAKQRVLLHSLIEKKQGGFIQNFVCGDGGLKMYISDLVIYLSNLSSSNHEFLLFHKICITVVRLSLRYFPISRPYSQQLWFWPCQ